MQFWSLLWCEESLDSLLVAIIMASGIVTLICIGYAYRKQTAESEMLTEIDRNGHKIKVIPKIEKLILKYNADTDKIEPYDLAEKEAREIGITALNSSAAVQNFLTEGTQKKLLKTSYVSDRLFSILSAVNTKNLVRKIPSLQDLHALTIQHERGFISSAFFRALAPGILVLGILGTLVGVHYRLPLLEESGNITSLAGALVPGALAVFFTVVVMILRGIYNKKLSRFLSEFDEYTLTQLLPFFRPISQIQNEVNLLSSTLHETKFSMLEELCDKTENFCLNMSAYGSTSEHMATLLGESLDTLHKTLEFGSQNNTLTNLIRKAIKTQTLNVLAMQNKYCSNLEQLWMALQGIALSLEQHYQSFAVPCTEFSLELRKKQPAYQRLKESHSLLGKYREQQFNCPNLAANTEITEKVSLWFSSLEEMCRIHHESVRGIDEIDEQVDDIIIQTSKTNLNSLGDIHKNIHCTAENIRQQTNAQKSEVQEMVEKKLVPKFREIKTYLEITLGKIESDRRKMHPGGWNGIYIKVREQVFRARQNRKIQVGMALTLAGLLTWSYWLFL